MSRAWDKGFFFVPRSRHVVFFELKIHHPCLFNTQRKTIKLLFVYARGTFAIHFFYKIEVLCFDFGSDVVI